jgi:hypothetical protein
MPSTEAMERRRREPHFSLGSKAGALQPTPSPDRSPAPARQRALAPGLSLVPHGCGDPLIRLVQAPRNNRVLEGWCAVARGRSRPVRSRGRGPGPAVVPGPGTGRQSHRRLQGRGCFQRGASLVCEAPLWSFDREAVERGGRRGPTAPYLADARAGVRPSGPSYLLHNTMRPSERSSTTRKRFSQVCPSTPSAPAPTSASFTIT